PNDRRVRRVELTPAGRTLVEQITDAGLADFRHLLGFLDTQTLRDALSVMTRIEAATVAFCRRDVP
ncbi:hypothetical protein ACFQ08_42465, partial [Streptosporangium algeriense]